ncbi:hypothetical protein [Desulfosporosinus fructosivorans]
MQKLNIFFHRDFDGLVSAAILTKILTLNGKFSDFDYHPVDYDSKDNWLNNRIASPCAVLDFLYHPDALYYFDHHNTSFLNKSLKDNFVEDNNHFWDPSFKSTPSLLKFKFKDQFDFERYSDLIEWANKIDSAEYSSPSEIYDYKNTYIVLNKLITHYYNNDQKIIQILNALLDPTLDDYINSERQVLSNIISEERYFMDIIYERMIIKNNTCFFDQSDINISFQRYLSYLYYPNIDYTVGILKKEKGFSVSIGFNPWKQNNAVNLGELASNFGGGGRKNVAGILSESHDKSVEIANNILRFLYTQAEVPF